MDRTRLSTRRAYRPPLGLLILGVLLLIALPHALEALDPRLLDLGSERPGFWPAIRYTAFKAALGVLVVGFGLIGLRAIGRWIPRWVALALLVLVALSPFLLARVRVAERDDLLGRYQEKTGFDVVRFHRASEILARRVGFALPEDARVALICRPGQVDTPVFLGFSLCPRLFYLLRLDDAAPDAAMLDRQRIGWILDCRDASYRSDFDGARLTRRADR